MMMMMMMRLILHCDLVCYWQDLVGPCLALCLMKVVPPFQSKVDFSSEHLKWWSKQITDVGLGPKKAFDSQHNQCHNVRPRKLYIVGTFWMVGLRINHRITCLMMWLKLLETQTRACQVRFRYHSSGKLLKFIIWHGRFTQLTSWQGKILTLLG